MKSENNEYRMWIPKEIHLMCRDCERSLSISPEKDDAILKEGAIVVCPHCGCIITKKNILYECV